MGEIGDTGEYNSPDMEDVLEKSDAGEDEPVEPIEYKLSDCDTRPRGLRDRRVAAKAWPLWASFMEYELAEAATPPVDTPTEDQLLPPIE